jgi:glycogen(starch) synthase
MRVLYWTELFWPYIGGVEVLAAKLVPALRERGYEVIVVTSHDHLDLPDTGQHRGIPIHRFPFRKALATRDPSQLMEIQKQAVRLKQHFKPDLIHMNYTGPAVYFHLRTAAAYPAPFLFTVRSALPIHAVGSDTLLGQALRTADWVTTCSEALLADARQLAPEITPRSCVIHNGLDEPGLFPAPLPSNPPRLLCLGRIVPKKGFDLALSAFASLRDRFPRARLVIGGDRPARPPLERQAAGLRLTHSVDFIGWVAPDKVPELMNTATVVIMPSRWEGLPNVALQAAVMARPVVATRVGGLPKSSCTSRPDCSSNRKTARLSPTRSHCSSIILK